MKYADSHEWIQVDEDVGLVGISSYARQELGEIVYTELPKVGKVVQAGDEVAVLESTKAAADIYSPVSGKITRVNEALRNDVSSLNTDPENTGWLYEIKLSSKDEIKSLLDEKEYAALVKV